MKRLLAGVASACLVIAAHGTTLLPVQLINPAGSTAGQAAVSTGPTTPPAWGSVAATSLAAQAANTVVANITASSASPTAVAIPTCNTSTSALQYTPVTGWTCYASSATTTGTLAQFAATTSAQLAGVLSDETGSGAAVFGTAPTISNLNATGTPTAPTAAVNTNTTQMATTAFVQTQIAAFGANRNQPYFQAYLGPAQSVTAGVNTKIQFNTKNYDTGSYYDNTTNYRYTPLVAGKYLVTVQLGTQGVSSSTNQYSTQAVYLYKNGAAVSAQQSQIFYVTSGTTLGSVETTTYLVGMNGTTDYIEGFGVVTTVGTPQFLGGNANSFIQAVYVGP